MAIEPPGSSPKTARAPTLQTTDIELDINFDLIERRRSVRPIPCPEAVERNDEESWSTWQELMAAPVKQDAQAAMAKVKRLLRRKPHTGNAS